MIGLGFDKNPISHANGPLYIGTASVDENLSVSDFELMNKHIIGLKVRLNSQAPFYFAPKVGSFVNGNENEASAGLFLKHERSFATRFLSARSYKESPW